MLGFIKKFLNKNSSSSAAVQGVQMEGNKQSQEQNKQEQQEKQGQEQNKQQKQQQQKQEKQGKKVFILIGMAFIVIVIMALKFFVAAFTATGTKGKKETNVNSFIQTKKIAKTEPKKPKKTVKRINTQIEQTQVRQTKAETTEAKRTVTVVESQPSQAQSTGTENKQQIEFIKPADVFKDFFFKQLDALIDEKQKELNQLSAQIENLKQTMSMLTTLSTKKVAESIEIHKNSQGNVKKVEIKLPDIKVYGIACDNNNCVAYTDVGVVGKGDVLDKYETVIKVTPTEIITNRRVIKF